MTHTDNSNHSATHPSDLLPFIELLERGAQVLDLGCGQGMDLAYLCESGFECSGIDSSPLMVTAARALHARSGVEISEKNFLFLTLDESSLDGVWSNLSFCELTPEALQRLLAICFKGVRVGGVMGAVLYEGSGNVDAMIDGVQKKIHLFTEKALCSMFEQTGFQVIKVGRKTDSKNPLAKILILAKRV